jgi:cysteine desulfurase/selenocysteine lyase
MKQDFPLFKNYPDLVYLDSSATSQKPQVVIDAVSNFYENYNSNIHRGIYGLSQKATDLFEEARKKVSLFINANNPSEIIFTSGATEAINMVAEGWGKKNLKKGDIVVLTEMEHHSNIVPWQHLKEEIGIELFFLPVNKEYRLNYKKIESLDLKKIRLVSLTHASNVLGTVNPLNEIIPYFRNMNSNIKVLVDAAQSIPHMPIDVKKLNCDFLVFSSHKMLGPSGVGVLYGKKELLEQMDPFVVGSHMIKMVTKEKATYADLPDKFEAGTRNIEGVIGLGAAIEYLNRVGFARIEQHEKELINYTLKMFARQKNLKLFGPLDSDNRLGVFSFGIGNVHPHDVSEILNRSHVAVRAGHHCAQPLMEVLEVTGTVRASIYLYNIKEDIDKLEHGIEEVRMTFKL